MKLRCRIGLHRWGRWDWSVFMALGSHERSQQRWCMDCRKIETRYLP